MFIARQYVASDPDRASNAIVAAAILVMFFVAICFHWWRTRQLISTHHPIDDLILKEMSRIVSRTTDHVCLFSILVLHRPF